MDGWAYILYGSHYLALLTFFQLHAVFYIRGLEIGIETQIKQFAIWRDDQNLLSQIGDIDFVAKGIKYHNACRLQYERIARVTPLGLKGRKGEINPLRSTTGQWESTKTFEAISYDCR